jgi:hypothetical protein
MKAGWAIENTNRRLDTFKFMGRTEEGPNIPNFYAQRLKS